jgi:alanyl-tRNA synthetase
LAAIEELAIRKIEVGGVIREDVLPLEVAKQKGAMMLFGEKYPDPVRMISIGDFSKELCGGTHLSELGDVLAFEILSEESVSSGTRRIQAITGERAKSNQQELIRSAATAANMLKVQVAEIPAAIVRLTDQLKERKKQLASGKKSGKDSAEGSDSLAEARLGDSNLSYFALRDVMRSAAATLNVPLNQVESRVGAILSEIQTLDKQLAELSEAAEIDFNDLIAGAQTVGKIQAIVVELPSVNPGLMKGLIDQIRKSVSSAAVFLASSPGAGKVLLAAGFSRDLVESGWSAGDWIRQIAPIVGGGGGGKPDLAQAGGKSPQKVGEALEAAIEYLKRNVEC